MSARACFKTMSDKSYLEMTDMTVLLEELLRQVHRQKPENPWDYAANYFRKVEMCTHILGADYMTVVSCRYNRQSFIYCCNEALRHFPPEERVSVKDFYSVLQLVCPDIPLSLIEDSALTGCTPVLGGDNGSQKMYRHEELSTSLFFRFIFTEWLIMLEGLFFEGKARSAKITLEPSRLKAKFEEWSKSENIAKPSLRSLQTVLADLESSCTECLEQTGENTQASANAINFDSLITALLRNKGVKSETTSFKPLTLARSSIFYKDTTGFLVKEEDGKEGIPSLPGIV